MLVQVTSMLATVSLSQMLLSKDSQTPKAQMFVESKIPRAWTANIHLQMIPHMYLSPRSYSAQGNTRILDQLTEVSLHTVH